MRLSVFGIGYVGCVSAACFAREGHEVTGVDANPVKVEIVNQRKTAITVPPLWVAAVDRYGGIGADEAEAAKSDERAIAPEDRHPSPIDRNLERDVVDPPRAAHATAPRRSTGIPPLRPTRTGARCTAPHLSSLTSLCGRCFVGDVIAVADTILAGVGRRHSVTDTVE